jgi:hypothetical protein
MTGGIAMSKDASDLVAQMHLEAIAHRQQGPVPSAEVRTVHYSELADLPPNSPIREEWQTYRRELPRLLAEGQAGRYALVKRDEIIGIFSTLDDAVTVGRAKYLFEPFLAQPIREREPLLRIRGLSLPCRNCTSPSRRTA